MKPNLFIGSSSEKLLLAYALQDQLSAKANVTIWNQGVFALNVGFLDSLIAQLKNSDFAAFVFSHDDILTIREETLASVRDNVLFEFGLFMGGLGKERVFFVVPQEQVKLRLPTDLLGITTVLFDASQQNIAAALGPACFKILQAIGMFGVRQDRFGAPDVEIIEKPKILCTCSPQYYHLSFEQDIALIRRETQRISTQITELHGANSQNLKNTLLENTFDIIHICAYVDPRTGETYFSDVDTNGPREGVDIDSITATTFSKLIEISKARLVILATCDSLILAAKLAKITNMVAPTDWVSIKDILDWELSFY
ncbi:MAG TPA: nucleotide-binding protein, partial [Terrimicrobiaceae bacterium]